MDRRIFGLETEYGVTFTLHGQRRINPDDVARIIFRRIVASGKSSNVFLENGSRLYLDVGSHPEYATAECDNLFDLLAQDRAGDVLMNELVDSAQRQISAEGTSGEIHLFKNNVDSAGNSYGCHENYCTERDEDLSRHEQFLIPFLITRQLFAGAGRVITTPSRGTYFSLSQRAEHIWETISSATTRSRPIINTRDEPHADPERYRRLHVILGDSNMSDFATVLKVGATSLVLSMVEDKNTVLRDLTLDNPMKALREVATDPLGDRNVTVRLTNGRELTAWQLQSEICERVENYVQGRDLSDDQRFVVAAWRATLDQMAIDPFVLADRIDWITKMQLITQLCNSEGVGLSHPKVALVDLLYHDTHPTRGIYNKLRLKGNTVRLVTDDAINLAVSTPPQTTRARLRGEFVRRAKEKRRDFTVDWVHLKLNDHVQRTLILKDPFKSHDERFDRLYETL